jgi:hypothetical protein
MCPFTPLLFSLWLTTLSLSSLPGPSTIQPTDFTTTASIVGGAASARHSALSSPPIKRRRAKRSEEERMEYLRSDPYVAKFEAYRVLCASCDKWIKLRPNSTYCSIPWDAHRKACLARKTSVRGSLLRFAIDRIR